MKAQTCTAYAQQQRFNYIWFGQTEHCHRIGRVETSEENAARISFGIVANLKVKGIVRHDQRSEACVWTSEFDAWVSASDACAAASLAWGDACELASLA